MVHRAGGGLEGLAGYGIPDRPGQRHPDRARVRRHRRLANRLQDCWHLRYQSKDPPTYTLGTLAETWPGSAGSCMPWPTTCACGPTRSTLPPRTGAAATATAATTPPAADGNAPPGENTAHPAARPVPTSESNRLTSSAINHRPGGASHWLLTSRAQVNASEGLQIRNPPYAAVTLRDVAAL